MKRDHDSTLSSSDEVDGTETKTRLTTEAQSRHPTGFKPFVTQDNHDKTPSELCPMCRTIDFRTVFSIQPSEISTSGKPVFALDNLHPRSSYTSCLACKMFASMAYPDLENSVSGVVKHPRSVWHLRAFRASSLWGIPATKVLLSQGVTVFVSLVLSPVSGNLSSDQRRESWKRGIILPTSIVMADENIPPTRSCKALEIGPYVQGTRIREMLDICLAEHSGCRTHTHNFPLNAYVIDCETRAIVQLRESMKYLALSYVWGKQSMAQSVHDDALRTGSLYPGLNVPLTIEDAILIVKMSGYRYLWVDRYCIQQHNNTEKQHQIRQMANIYSNAVATICVLGAHANTGIEGISMPRKSQCKFESQKAILVRCPWPEASLQYHLQNSLWSTRGWTFQEPLLSKRCLFFTPEYVIHVCQTNTNIEALIVSGTEQPFRSLKLTALIFESGLDWLDARVKSHAFTREVQQYQRRNFTYDYDTLNAFRGILSVIKMRSYWGVPILNPMHSRAKHNVQLCMTLGFAVGLLWHVTDRIKQLEPWNNENRYKLFPSWSWISQTGVLVDFISFAMSHPSSPLTDLHLGFSPSKTKFAAEIWAERSDGTRMSIDGLFPNRNDGNCAPEQTTFLVVSSITAKWKLENGDVQDDQSFRLKNKNSSQVALSHISDDIIQSMSCGIALLSLDRQLPSVDEQNHVAPTTQEGFAILILISTYFTLRPKTYWLAVRPFQDGTFRREGVIESGLLATFDQEFEPEAESLTTIRLG